MFYYAGFNTNPLFSNDGNIVFAIDSFTQVPFPEMTDFQIGWSYFLLWKKDGLYISKKFERSEKVAELVQIPNKSPDSCKQAATGRDNIVILSKDNELWRYKIYENSWKKVENFLFHDRENPDRETEYPVKVAQGGCTVVLSNLGRVFNVPVLVDMPKRVRFADIACGFDHAILLAGNGDIYSMGMGTRGQLGHNDLEDCDNPRLIEALAGVKVVEISAAGWHSAVVTDQGDLYTWGWNTNGELGLADQQSKVTAVPTLVEFADQQNESGELLVRKVRCGNTFTICMTEDGTLWGSGCNKYGQLGQSREKLPTTSQFVKLHVPPKRIRDFGCREWGTVLVTD